MSEDDFIRAQIAWQPCSQLLKLTLSRGSDVFCPCSGPRPTVGDRTSCSVRSPVSRMSAPETNVCENCSARLLLSDGFVELFGDAVEVGARCGVAVCFVFVSAYGSVEPVGCFVDDGFAGCDVAAVHTDDPADAGQSPVLCPPRVEIIVGLALWCRRRGFGLAACRRGGSRG